jgi:hypothetical protein
MQTLFIADTRKEFKPLLEKYLNINTKTSKNNRKLYDINIEQFYKNTELSSIIVHNDVLVIFENRYIDMISKEIFSLKPSESFDEFMSNCPDKVICIGFKAVKL